MEGCVFKKKTAKTKGGFDHEKESNPFGYHSVFVPAWGNPASLRPRGSGRRGTADAA
jgi:hypothetical protein